MAFSRRHKRIKSENRKKIASLSNSYTNNKQQPKDKTTKEEDNTKKEGGGESKGPHKWLKEMSKQIRSRSSPVMSGPMQVMRKRHREEMAALTQTINAERNTLYVLGGREGREVRGGEARGAVVEI